MSKQLNLYYLNKIHFSYLLTLNIIACAPSQCTFEYIGRRNLFFAIITIIGIFGGLSSGLKILIFIIFRFFEKLMNNLSRLGLKRIIKNILLIITLCVIYSFSISTLQLTTMTLTEPTFSTYENLIKHYPNSLQCSCSHISIKYQLFLSIQPRFHQICSSEFISNNWIEYLYDRSDYRASATSQLQLLASLCQLSQQTLNNSILQLMTNDFITSQLLSSKLSDERLQIVINQFLDTINLVREMIADNMIISSLSTSWRFILDTVIHIDWTIHTAPVIYNDCNCGLSSKCTPVSNGMMAGCYSIEALLQTSLQCFYDQQCIDSDSNFSPLDISILEISQFNMNTTIEGLLNHLMVEEYFNACAPSSCTYSYHEHGSTFETIISLIGLYGGLVIITRCIPVILTEIWFYRKTRVTPITT